MPPHLVQIGKFELYRKRMRKFSFTIIAALFILPAFSQGFEITLKTPSYKAGTAFLTYHMGKNLNVEDSAEVNSNGIAVFKGDRTLQGGIYVIVFPGKNLSVDFLVDKEQKFTVTADSANLAATNISPSKDNQLFSDYKKYVAVKGAQLQAARAAYMGSANKKDSLENETRFNTLNKELVDYRNGIIEKNPESFLAALLSAMKEPTLPHSRPVTRQDSLDNYNYYKAHYWDGITFMDGRIIRTPFFLPKLERYYREVMPQSPDSLIKDIDYKLLLARNDEVLFRFMLNWLTDEYINPKYMGQDKVFVHLFEKYHSKGLSPWLNEKQMETITRRAYMQMLNLVGEKAADLNMLDSTGKTRNLYGVNSDYTVVVFWDPNCGHCKEELPRIDSVYRATWKADKVKIYAVLTEDHKKEWVNYIKKHELGDWIHVYQPKEIEDAEVAANKPSFRQLYDVIQTPTIYLLDKEKRIIGKKLTWSQINDLLAVERSKTKTGKTTTQ